MPREEAAEALRGLGQPADSVTTPYTHLVVNTGDHWVLADMGAARSLIPRVSSRAT